MNGGPDAAHPVRLAARAAQALSRACGLMYAQIAPDLTVVQASPNFRMLMADSAVPVEARPIADLLEAFVGAEDALADILHGEAPAWQLERVNQDRPDGSTGYLTFRVIPLDDEQPRAGLLLMVEDVTLSGRLEQHLVQNRNELRLAQAQLARTAAEVERLAMTDGLTGLANRRRFDEELARELERAARYSHPTALVLWEVDNFDKFNYTSGHPLGDELLRAIAQVQRQRVRTVDTLARFGAQEFALILPEADLKAAAKVAERLRATVERNAELQSLTQEALADTRPPAPLTVSLGVALAPVHATTPAALLHAADAALHEAKHAGKNRVAVYRPGDPL